MILPCADYSSSSLQNLIHARIPIGVIKSIFPIFCVKRTKNFPLISQLGEVYLSEQLYEGTGKRRVSSGI